ncbi:hypothetical protein [Bacillus sp. AFS040349]|uniref:hypothetical protein n=1 Tax=Bacillus sp. AFS040349 TaxID=2033502 RepID=UPI000BFE5A01|nr:hypothetical protein [Bacillus sp. AFS040349]PGT83278.1 hypothetical protein COD11_13160 [Bacillus sp. AFS040349]
MKEPITIDQKNIAAEYIYLTILLDDLEKDIETFKKVPVKLQEPYLALLDSKIKKVLTDMAAVKKQMKEEKIKVVFPDKKANEDFWYFDYFVNGYKSEFHFLEAALRNHVNRRMQRYLFGS